MREFTELGRTTDNLDKVQVFEETNKMLTKLPSWSELYYSKIPDTKGIFSIKYMDLFLKKRVSGLPNIFAP